MCTNPRDCNSLTVGGTRSRLLLSASSNLQQISPATMKTRRETLQALLEIFLSASGAHATVREVRLLMHQVVELCM